MLHQLDGIGGSERGEALARSIDDVQIAIRSVVPAQAEVGAGCLRVRGVHLQHGREKQEPSECVVRLDAAERDRKISLRQAESVPLLAEVERQVLTRAV